MKKKGLTLVELIIVIALAALISISVITLTGFSNKTYKNGADQYDVQSDLRLISNIISDNLKYAYNIEILNSISDESTVKINDNANPLYGYNYIYLQYNDDNSNKICDDNEGIAIKKIMFDASTKTYNSSTISYTRISGLIYNLVFNYSEGSIIEFNLSTSNDNKEMFSLNTKIDIMNAHLGSVPTIPSGYTVKTGKAIRFKLDPQTTTDSGTIINYPPVASSVNITGTASVGETLQGSYSYSDAESDLESSTLFRWENKYDSEPETEWVPIPGADAYDYTLTNSDYGKIVRFVVIPYASTGASPGEASASLPTQVVTGYGISKPSVSNLSIDSTDKNYNCGCVLTANYSFSTLSKNDYSIITWYKVFKDKGKETITRLQKGPQQSYRCYTTKSDDIGGTIYFTVEPINELGIHGDIKYSDPIGFIKK